MQNRVGRTADLRSSVLTGGGATLDERTIREALPRVPLDVLAAPCFVLKVTLSEALDPELFDYLARFDNPRLRAGALRALANAGARLKHIAEPGLQIVQVPIPTERATAIDPACESATVSPSTLSPSKGQLSETAAVPQFLDDEIGDQFARF